MPRARQRPPAARLDAIPRETRSVRAAKIRNWAVAGAIGVAVLAGPAGAVIATNAAGGTAALAGELEALRAEQAHHRAYATTVAHAWIDGGTVPTPTAAGVSSDLGRPDGVDEDDDPVPAVPFDVDNVAWDGAEIVVEEGRAVELHRFVLTGPDRLWRLTVPVAEGPGPTVERGFPALGGYPTLEAWTVMPGEIRAASWPERYEPTRLPGPAADRVREWADAYAADDARALYALVGDSEGVVYRGVGGATVEAVSIGQAAIQAGEDEDRRIMVKVDVTYVVNERRWVGSHDLLVIRPDQPLPNIVAWGARGSGPTLTPYQNAVPVGTYRSGVDPDHATFRPSDGDTTELDSPADSDHSDDPDDPDDLEGTDDDR